MMTDPNKTHSRIFVQENMSQMMYGINQDNIPGMVRYFRCDSDYEMVKKVLARAFMEFLDNNKPDGKMCLSNGECYDIEKAFNFGDWEKLMRYAEKYAKK